jgi:hypothetical protein
MFAGVLVCTLRSVAQTIRPVQLYTHTHMHTIEEYINVYVVLPYDEWVEMKRTGTHVPVGETDIFSERVNTWLRPQVLARMGEAPDDRIEEPGVYAWVSKPKHLWPPRIKRAILKVRVPTHRAVLFDDIMYVRLLNTVGNGHRDFFSFSEAEESATHTPDEIEASMQRTFAPHCYGATRSRMWCGVPDMRAFIPSPLLRTSVRKVWIYHGAKRLRK